MHSIGVFSTLGECNWLKRSAIGRSNVVKYSPGGRLPKQYSVHEVVSKGYTYSDKFDSSVGHDTFLL
jgi:hypothetical protein